MLQLDYTPLNVFGANKLAAALQNDTAPTAYNKDNLVNKVRACEVGTQNETDHKISGYVVSLRDSDTLFGFVLVADDKITDMYTFEEGRGKNLFQLIGFFMKAQGWNGEFNCDKNAQPLEQFFSKAATDPMEHEYRIRA